MSYTLERNGEQVTVTKLYETLEGCPKIVVTLRTTTPEQAKFWGIATDGTTYCINADEPIALCNINNLIEAEGKRVLQTTWKPQTMTWKAWTKKWSQRVYEIV